MMQQNSLWQLALRKFRTKTTGLISLAYICLCGFFAVFCYLFAPDSSNSANQMHLEIHSKPPGFEATILSIPETTAQSQSSLSKILFGTRAMHTEIAIDSYRISTTHLITSAIDSKLEKKYPLSLFQQQPKNYLQQRTFWFGTDKYGRDLLSRILVGARISFFIGFIAVFISLLVGIPLGALAGYYGGKVDAFIMWIINITWSIPTLLLVIAITLALGKGYWQVFIAVGLTMWVEVARVVRGQVMTTKQQQYVEAARALGYSDVRIIFKHILPNILAPIIVISAANFAAAILIESGLSFLGIGAQPPTPSWGAIIKNHYNYIIVGKPYLALIPGMAIMMLVMAFMLLGNTLRDTLDVKG
jgi:peptide/nickel transport system permease protein